MSGKIIKFYPNNAANNPDNVLEKAIGNYESIFMVGYDKNGEIDARASLNLSKEQLLWVIEKSKALILAINDEERC